MTGLYIHIPFCVKKCAYCNFASVAGSPEAMKTYTRSLLCSMDFMAALAEDRTFDTLFIGGGTPSILPPALLTAIVQGAEAHFTLTPEGERTIEANPGTLSPEKLTAYREAGLTRISLGLQAAQPHLLQTIGRIHTRDDYCISAAAAGNAGFKNLNTDVMAGLPGQTPENLRETLELAAAYSTHISLYGLQLEEGTPLEASIRTGKLTLPSEDAVMDMLEAGKELLASEGFHQYEVSNYAREGFECRHNLIYWQYGQWLGLGASAASHWGDCHYTLPDDLDAYVLWVEAGCPSEGVECQELSPRDAAFEELMMGLRLIRGVDTLDYRLRRGYTPREAAPKALAILSEKNLLRETDGFLRLTPRGFEVMNGVLEMIMEEFFPD
ncbi:MAG: radical SAM family heme chaperone HemW [Christensenellales bacterium]|jgi:oxygen-independent coproporphyrinogen-3 oxidase